MGGKGIVRDRMPKVLDGIEVLVADDDIDNLDVLAHLMTEYGAVVRTAGSAQEVLDLIPTWTPDVLLLDIAMPLMDGYDLLKAIRREAMLRDVPAVAVTAGAYERDKQRALEEGFAAHISKPVDIDTLVNLVRSLVTKKT